MNRRVIRKETRKPSKYKAVKTTVLGVAFDSKGEGSRYYELKLQERAGSITGLALQPEFVLQEKFRRNGVLHRAIKYRADFEYTQLDGQTVVEDFKGKETAEFRIKKKLFLAVIKHDIYRISTRGGVRDF